MPAYMTQFSYTQQAAAALVKNPEDRGAVFSEQVEKLGGQVLAFYHCIGQYDGVTIYEVPDQATVEALLLAIRAPGHLEKIETTELHLWWRLPWRGCVRRASSPTEDLSGGSRSTPPTFGADKRWPGPGS